MKHLATFVLLAVAAVSASAAQIDWKIGLATNKFYDSNGNELAKVNAYLILSTKYENWEKSLSTPSSASEVNTVLNSISLDGAKEYVDLKTSGTFTSSSTDLRIDIW